MQFDRSSYTDEFLLNLYQELLTPRLIEERMLILLRQGVISKWFSGIGQEAVSVGATAALEKDEYILPLHRNLGVFTVRKVPMRRLFAQFQGKISGFTKGRDRSFHFGSLEHHIVGMISHLGAQLPVADGIALAEKLSATNKVTLVFSGDGGTSEGDFHEALNIASVWKLPVIFLIENNGYGLSTPTHEQYAFKNFSDKGPAYGVEAYTVDGNNVLDVYTTVRNIAQKIRLAPAPVIIEANTFRMRGHEEASGTQYVPQQLFEQWMKKDPVENFENFLFNENLITQKQISDIREQIKVNIEQALQQSLEDSYPLPDIEQEIADVYFPYKQSTIYPATNSKTKKRYIDAISDALSQSLDRFQNLILMGQDIAEYGGVFKVTEGFVKKYGKDRIRNTPLCESAVIGMGLGLSVKGYKTVVEMQFADFISCGFNQVVNNLAKTHYRWGQHADVVIRMPTGAGTGGGPFHSQSNEAWFFHTPGLILLYPAFPYDAKGLLNAAIENPNPVMYFEHKALYRSVEQEIPDDYYTLPIGKAAIVREGNELTIVAYGMAVHWAQNICTQENIDADIIDLRTLLPWDKETVFESVKKTGKVIVVNEDTLTGSISAEIAACIAEYCFQYLDAPVMREASLDTPVPFAKSLEQQFLPFERMKDKILKLSMF
ncbi:MAG: dehydrogenase E1 component subunit alpha/beta [Cytophagaceae bacterium]|nr:dehydrogenase E1 component subunit alpha/beta [Cytophagaceae bacterium]MDW8456568.1 dehydrogenase E1 component subunit alpha/beta [Cytophagaceae bacterium]